MNLFEPFQIAFASIFANKARSFLTMLGVIIGVSAVITLVSVGQGVKNDLSRQISDLGSNLLIVIAGKINLSQPQQQISATQFLENTILSEKDLETIKTTEGIVKVAPITLVNGNLKYQEKTSGRAILVGTTKDIKETTNFKISEGRPFTEEDYGKFVVVLGKMPKEDLFGEEKVIGKKVLIGKKEFEVIGVLEKPGGGNLLGGDQFESLVAIPYQTAKDLAGGPKIFRILVKVADNKDIKEMAKIVREKILENHQGEENFSVLTQEDILKLLGSVLNLMTLLITMIAAISLIVGGVGIMNIMLVSVAERTREIGLRKAVGATSAAILFQFLIEAIVVSFLGGAIGLGVALATMRIIELRTNLIHPLLNLPTVLLAGGVCIGIGIIFGLLPAIRAARFDPIKALRYE